MSLLTTRHILGKSSPSGMGDGVPWRTDRRAACDLVLCLPVQGPLSDGYGFVRGLRAHRNVSGAHREFHQPGDRGQPTDVPWAVVFPDVESTPPHPSSCTRRASKDCILIVLGIIAQVGGFNRPRIFDRRRRHWLRACVHRHGIVPRARCTDGATSQANNGNGAFIPMVAIGLLLLFYSSRSARRPS